VAVSGDSLYVYGGDRRDHPHAGSPALHARIGADGVLGPWQQGPVVPASAAGFGAVVGDTLIARGDKDVRIAHILAGGAIGPWSGWIEALFLSSSGGGPAIAHGDAVYTIGHHEMLAMRAGDAKGVLESDVAKHTDLDSVVRAAFEAGELERARLYADELLWRGQQGKGEWYETPWIHHAHIFRGRVALQQHKLEEAKRELLAAGDPPGQFGAFGPNMSLAKELLEKGERAVVLEYLKECSQHWSSKQLERWTQQVERGGMPDFGANLEY
jgi:hypothetical protein